MSVTFQGNQGDLLKRKPTANLSCLRKDHTATELGEYSMVRLPVFLPSTSPSLKGSSLQFGNQVMSNKSQAKRGGGD